MYQRARKDEDKQARRQGILDAARALCVAGVPFERIMVADVAERAGIAKGTLYLYFKTKEELLLALLEQLLDAWFPALAAALDGGRGRWSGTRVAEIICQTLAEHAPAARLLAVLQAILEHHIDADTALRFKQRLLAHMTAIGPRVEARLPYLQPGEGTRVLLQANALLVGLQQMAEPSEVVRAVLARPEMAPLRIDFERELVAALATLLEGYRRRDDARHNGH